MEKKQKLITNPPLALRQDLVQIEKINRQNSLMIPKPFIKPQSALMMPHRNKDHSLWETKLKIS